jgi:hypothetical protein
MHNLPKFCDALQYLLCEALISEDSSAPNHLYLTTGLISNWDTSSSQFTALASLFFIHRSIISNVEVWDFNQQQFKFITTNRETPFMVDTSKVDGDDLQNGNSNNFCVSDGSRWSNHHKFFNTKSRKGFLHTKWKIEDLHLDLVNCFKWVISPSANYKYRSISIYIMMTSIV